MEINLMLAVLCVIITLLYAFSNGFHDAGNIIAPMVSSRAMSPRSALLLAAFFEFLGVYLLGTAVAKTISLYIVDPYTVAGTNGAFAVLAALSAALVWNMFTWYLKMPASSSHTLIGGIFGAFAGGFGFGSLLWHKIMPIVLMLFFAPVICFILTNITANIFYFIGRWFGPGINKWLKLMQIFASSGLALASGSNDAQKAMGVIVFSLAGLGYLGGGSSPLIVPKWVVTGCACSLSAGILFGGWRVAKTLGTRLYKIRAVHGFTAQTNSFGILLAASVFGFPVSTTQVAASSLMGAGASGGFKRVRWNVFFNIAYTWLITMPAAFLLGYLFVFIVNYFKSLAGF